MSFNKNVFVSVPKPKDIPSKMSGLPVVDLINKYYSESTNKLTNNNSDFVADRVKTLKKFNKKHDVCGKGNYVKRAFWRQDNTQDGPCHKCPPIKDIKQYIDDKKNVNLNNKGYPHVPTPEQLNNMCDENIYNWFSSQYDANPYKADDVGKYDWTNIQTVISNDKKPANINDIDTIRDWYINRLDDDDLQKLMERLNWGTNIKKDRLIKFKEEISKGRGSTVECSPKPPTWLNLKNDNLSTEQKTQLDYIKKDGCSKAKKFGPKYIIAKEYEEWSADYMTDPKNLYESGRGDFKLWGKPLMPINREFEQCINDTLNENSNKYDENMIQGIHGKDSIYQLDNTEILFIKRKLQMLFADKSSNSVIECIKQNMMLDTTICKAGLTEQMNFVLNVLFSIIGFKFNLHELNSSNPSNKDRLIYIIDQLGDIIPKALRKIVDISKKIEIEQCGGVPSNNTLVLEELYKKIFTSGKTVVNFDFGISDMISKASNQEFDRTTVMAVLAIAFLKYF